MQNDRETPALRFRGHDGDWSRDEFSGAFDCSVSNNTFSRAELNYDSGDVLDVHYGDVLVKYGDVLDVRSANLPYISGRKGSDFQEMLLQDGDVVLADTAEDETAGKACEIAGVRERNVVAGLHTLVCRPRAEAAPGFWGYYLNSDCFHRQLLPLLQGIKVLSLSKSALVKTTVQYPASETEQRQIADCLRSVDQLRDYHQREYDLLLSLRSTCLGKMFPEAGSDAPSLRFTGFSEPWGQHAIGELIKREPYLPYLAAPQAGGRYEIIQQGNDPVVGYANGEPYADFEHVILFGDHTLSLYRPKAPFFVATDGIRIISCARQMDTDYLFYLLERYKPRSEGYKRYYSVLADSPCRICTGLAEQRKIGSFFKTLDELISLQKRRLQKIAQTRNAMHRKMFV